MLHCPAHLPDQTRDYCTNLPLPTINSVDAISQRSCTRCSVQLEDSDSQVTLCDTCLLAIDSQDRHSVTGGLAHDTTRSQDSPTLLSVHIPNASTNTLNLSMPDYSDGSSIYTVGCGYGNDALLSIVKCLEDHNLWYTYIQRQRWIMGASINITILHLHIVWI